jgi:hypothetical protein
MLEFATAVDGKNVEGVDKLTFDQAGMIRELKAMIRHLPPGCGPVVPYDRGDARESHLLAAGNGRRGCAAGVGHDRRVRRI